MNRLHWNGSQAFGANGREYIMWPKHGHWHVSVLDINDHDKIIGELTCEYTPSRTECMQWADEFENNAHKGSLV